MQRCSKMHCPFSVSQYCWISSLLQKKNISRITVWKTIIYFHYSSSFKRIFHPVFFDILKEPELVQKPTVPQKKGLNLSLNILKCATNQDTLLLATLR